MTFWEQILETRGYDLAWSRSKGEIVVTTTKDGKEIKAQGKNRCLALSSLFDLLGIPKPEAEVKGLNDLLPVQAYRI